MFTHKRTENTATADHASHTMTLGIPWHHAMHTANPYYTSVPGYAPEIRIHRDEAGNALGHTAVYTPDNENIIWRNFDTAEVAAENG